MLGWGDWLAWLVGGVGAGGGGAGLGSAVGGGWLDWVKLSGAVWLGRCCNFAFPQESLAGEVLWFCMPSEEFGRRAPTNLFVQKQLCFCFYKGVLPGASGNPNKRNHASNPQYRLPLEEPMIPGTGSYLSVVMITF